MTDKKETESKKPDEESVKPKLNPPPKPIHLSAYEVSQLTMEDIARIEEELHAMDLDINDIYNVYHDGIEDTPQAKADYHYAKQILDHQIQLGKDLYLEIQYVKYHSISHLYHQALEPLRHPMIWRLGLYGSQADMDEGRTDEKNHSEAEALQKQIHNTELAIYFHTFKGRPEDQKHIEDGLEEVSKGDALYELSDVHALKVVTESNWAYPDEDAFYFLLHGYLIYAWQDQNKTEKYLNLKDFLNWDKELGDGIHTLDSLKKLIGQHISKPSTTGITKKLENNIPKTAGNWYSPCIDDYIAMQKELGMPVIDEERTSSDKVNFAKFFLLIYGNLAYTLDDLNEHKHNYSQRVNMFNSALKRYQEHVENDEEKLYPMLQYLYNEYSHDQSFIKELVSFGMDDKGWNKRGYGSHRFARLMLDRLEGYHGEFKEMIMVQDDDDYRDRIVGLWYQWIDDYEEYQEALDKEPVSMTFGTWIKHKYFNIS